MSCRKGIVKNVAFFEKDKRLGVKHHGGQTPGKRLTMGIKM